MLRHGRIFYIRDTQSRTISISSAVQQRVVLAQIHSRHLHQRCHRQRRVTPQQRLYRLFAQRPTLIQQLQQRCLHLRLPLPRCQTQNVQILTLGTARLTRYQCVVSPPVRHRRIHVLPVHVAGKRSRLPRQPLDHMPIIDLVLALATQPFHPLHQLPAIPHLDLLGADPRLDLLADQPRRHRITIPQHLDRAATTDTHPLSLQRLQPPSWQRLHVGLLFHELLLPAGIALLHDLPQKPFVLFPAGKVRTATQQQCLGHGVLETPMSLLAVAVLMTTGWVGRLAYHPVMPQQGSIVRREFLGVAVLVDGQRHPIRAMPLGHQAQRPESVLQPFAETGETLRKTNLHVFPVRVGQHEVVDQVSKRLPPNGHPKVIHVTEVR